MNDLTLRVTLIADGSSDKTLINIIKWLLNDWYPKLATNVVFADFRNLRKPPKKSNVPEQIATASEYYPFDILVYHRDAESLDKDIVGKRKKEILDNKPSSTVVVCVTKVMMEAWLLISEKAIKKSAGNPNSTTIINLPPSNKLEAIPDPKKMLHDFLTNASGLKGRRLATFNVHQAVHLVADNIDSYESLRALSAFQVFEADLKTAVDYQLVGRYP